MSQILHLDVLDTTPGKQGLQGLLAPAAPISPELYRTQLQTRAREDPWVDQALERLAEALRENLHPTLRPKILGPYRWVVLQVIHQRMH